MPIFNCMYACMWIESTRRWLQQPNMSSTTGNAQIHAQYLHNVLQCYLGNEFVSRCMLLSVFKMTRNTTLFPCQCSMSDPNQLQRCKKLYSGRRITNVIIAKVFSDGWNIFLTFNLIPFPQSLTHRNHWNIKHNKRRNQCESRSPTGEYFNTSSQKTRK